MPVYNLYRKLAGLLNFRQRLILVWFERRRLRCKCHYSITGTVDKRIFVLGLGVCGPGQFMS